jgi:multiple sugar transport system permease protein
MSDAPLRTAGTGAVTVAPAPVITVERGRWPRPTGKPLKIAFFLTLLAGLSVLFTYPFIWTISASLKPQEEVFDNRLIPATFHPSNYADVWDKAPVLTWFMNSVWIGVVAAAAVTFSSAIVAFGFAYFRFPGRNALFGLVLATMMLPGAVTMIPVYLIWNHLNLVNTQYPLWVPNLFGSAFYIFLQRQFFLGIPREYFEAARMDGDNFFTMFWRIALPLAKPALIVAFIFEIEASWNDLMKPLIYLRDEQLFTMPLGLKTVLDSFGQGGGGEGDWQIIIAALVIATVPMIVIFALFQKYFIEGISTSGRKG